MKRLINYYNLIKSNWVSIAAILALFMGGASTVSTMIKQENLLIQQENLRMKKEIPKGPLYGYNVDLVYILEATTETDGLPGQKYIRDRTFQNKYVVLPTVPYKKLMNKHYNSEWYGWELAEVANIREVATVREANEEVPVIKVIEDSEEKE